MWRIGVEADLANKGLLSVDELKSGEKIKALKFVRSGNLGLALFVRAGGLDLVSMYDFVAREELLALILEKVHERAGTLANVA